MDTETAKHTAQKRGRAKRRYGKAGTIVGIVLCVLLLPFVIVNMTLMVHTMLHPELPPNFLGYTPLVVESGSMSPFFETDSLVIVHNIGEEEAAALETGTVICFKSGSVYVTHRIVGTETSEDGQPLYVTQGDANNTPDTQRVAPEQVLGTYVTHINGMGGFVLFMQTPTGMICCVILPLALIVSAFWLSSKLADWQRRKAKPNGETEQDSVES